MGAHVNKQLLMMMTKVNSKMNNSIFDYITVTRAKADRDEATFAANRWQTDRILCLLISPLISINAAIQQPTPQPVRQPSLMDHVIALRQEVAMLSQQVQASGQVTEAVGQAVGQLYAMFQPTAQGNAQGTSYSENFQQSVDETDY